MYVLTIYNWEIHKLKICIGKIPLTSQYNTQYVVRNRVQIILMYSFSPHNANKYIIIIVHIGKACSLSNCKGLFSFKFPRYFLLSPNNQLSEISIVLLSLVHRGTKLKTIYTICTSTKKKEWISWISFPIFFRHQKSSTRTYFRIYKFFSFSSKLYRRQFYPLIFLQFQLNFPSKTI